jgi:hypothetical protein
MIGSRNITLTLALDNMRFAFTFTEEENESVSSTSVSSICNFLDLQFPDACASLKKAMSKSIIVKCNNKLMKHKLTLDTC